MARVLVIDDEPEACELIALVLGRAGIDVVSVHEPRFGLDRIVDERFDAVLTDLTMPGMDGIELCERVIGARPDIPVVVFTGYGEVDVAIRAMRAGATDFLTKPLDGQLLLVVVRRAIERRRLTRELERLRVVSPSGDAEDGILGSSAAMRRVFALVRRVASRRAKRASSSRARRAPARSSSHAPSIDRALARRGRWSW
ncbi:MAG: response regulator [Labilithrix sp.]